MHQQAVDKAAEEVQAILQGQRPGQPRRPPAGADFRPPADGFGPPLGGAPPAPPHGMGPGPRASPGMSPGAYPGPAPSTPQSLPPLTAQCWVSLPAAPEFNLAQRLRGPGEITDFLPPTPRTPPPPPPLPSLLSAGSASLPHLNSIWHSGYVDQVTPNANFTVIHLSSLPVKWINAHLDCMMTDPHSAASLLSSLHINCCALNVSHQMCWSSKCLASGFDALCSLAEDRGRRCCFVMLT